MNLRLTDNEWEHNLEIAGGSLDKVAFVRNASYLQQMSEVVTGQEQEIVKLNKDISKQADLWEENQLLKETI